MSESNGAGRPARAAGESLGACCSEGGLLGEHTAHAARLSGFRAACARLGAVLAPEAKALVAKYAAKRAAATAGAAPTPAVDGRDAHGLRDGRCEGCWTDEACDSPYCQNAPVLARATFESNAWQCTACHGYYGATLSCVCGEHGPHKP